MQNSDRILCLLAAAKRAGASDLLLVAGSPPTIYVDTRMQMLPPDGRAAHPAGAADAALTPGDLEAMVTSLLNAKQGERLSRHRDVDFSIGHPNLGRCRVNVHYQRRTPAIAVRFVNSEIPELDRLNLPAQLAALADLPRGLVLVTGPTGSGKSTTLAALLQQMNRRRRAHVITLEDPIEFAFKNDKSIIEQREIGDDSPSFGEALRHVVRQKPDVILVGEMRDLETMSAALSAADTGHLVLASMHTNTAAQTIERVVDAFDSRRQHQVRVQLSATLKAVVCQVLFPNERDGGMIPAVERLIMTPAIARAIRENDTHLIDGMIETGGQHGMQPLDAAIAQLVRKGLVSRETAMTRAADPERLRRLLGSQARPGDVEPPPLSTQASALIRQQGNKATRQLGTRNEELGTELRTQDSGLSTASSPRPWE